MDLKLIKNLLNMISDSDVNEVSIEEGEFKIKIKKQPDVVQQRGNTPVSYIQAPGTQAQAAPPPNPVAESSTGETSSDTKGKSPGTIIIKSPIVGTFYEAPAPDLDPYVQPGSAIKKGETICIIEAMKIMNEIESEHDGKIVKILVNNAQPVEFDQPLFELDPS
jgi:acetyl-CoA carboxylase biotin carboxyl carrier protein